MLRNNFDFSLVVNGGSVKEYEHQGQVFVEGKKGTEFSIRLKNNTHKRCLAVITVDGKSVIDGAPGNLDTGGGYIIDAYSSVTIPGWRLNNDAVAKFVFADPQDSYVAQSDDDASAMDNIGVIGCAMFYEQPAPVWVLNQPFTTRSSSAIPDNMIWYGSSGGTVPLSNFSNNVTLDSMECSATLASANSVCNLGTGFGAASNHTVRVESFQRCTEPETVFTLYYDTRIGLEARGVNLKATACVCPSPFPASAGRGCTPPANWDGNAGTLTKPYGIKLRPNTVTINPQVQEVKRKKVAEEVQKLIKKQVRELQDLKTKIEQTDIKIDTDLLDELQESASIKR